MHRETATRIERLLDQQSRVVSAAQLSRLGLPRLAQREVAAGRWRRLHRGIYLAAAGQPSDEQRCRAALLFFRNRPALTGVAACRLWGIRDVPPLHHIALLVPDSRRAAAPDGLVVHATGRLPSVSRVRGLPVVALDRAVVDACRGVSLRDCRALVAEVVRDNACTTAELRGHLGPGGARGCRHLQRALADVDAGARSAPEAEVADLLRRDNQLRPFLLNPELRIDGEWLGRPDVWFPGRGLGLEVDSVRHHTGSLSFGSTMQRHRRFERLGLTLLHMTPRHVRANPDRVLAEVREAARDRAHVPEPPGLTVGR